MTDDPASWVPSTGLVNHWFSEEGPTEHMDTAVLDVRTVDELVSGWRGSDDECPLLLTLLGELYETATEEAAA